MKGPARLAALGAFICLALLAAALLGACSMGGGIATKRYAAVFGVSDYLNIDDLTYADDDAVSMADMLSNKGYSLLAAKTNSGATRSAILALLGDAAATIGTDEDALFLFYFSGHGARTRSTTGGEEYIVPYDASATVSSLISTVQLSDALSQLRCKNIVVIIDSCYSGGFVDTGSAIDAEPEDYESGFLNSVVFTALSNFGALLSANAEEGDATPPITISASGSSEESSEPLPQEPNIGHGYFTYYFLEAAEKGDDNNDGYVTAVEAYKYAVNGIERDYNSEDGADYLPRISGGARDLVLFED